MKLVRTLVLSATLAPGLSSVESLTIHPSEVWHVFVPRVHYLATVALVKVVKQLLVFYLVMHVESYFLPSFSECQTTM